VILHDRAAEPPSSAARFQDWDSAGVVGDALAIASECGANAGPSQPSAESSGRWSWSGKFFILPLIFALKPDRK